MAGDGFDYTLFGTQVRYGNGVANALPDALSALGALRPLILTQDRIAGSPRYEALVARLTGLQILQCAGIPAHSDEALVERIAVQARDFRADSIVAIGGGSVADTAKAVAMLLAEGGSLDDHATAFTPPDRVYIPLRTQPLLPIVALPTTASGAENTPSFGVRNAQGEKLLFWNRQAASTVLLIDPALSADVAPDLLRQTALNGIAHCMEGLYSRRRGPVSDCLAIAAMLRFRDALERTDMAPDDQRGEILLAAHMAGMVLSMARSCLHHAICHVIGAHYRLGHGLVNTVMLPHALRFNEPVAGSLLQPALHALNQRAGAAYPRLSDWVASLVDRLGMPASLSALGLPREDLPEIARHVMRERGLALNPRPVADDSEVLAILHHAYA